MTGEVVGYSFCESVNATGISPWCIRKLSSQGQMLGGGVDTDSLCGRIQSPFGWDLPVRVSLAHPYACKRCLEVIKKG